MPHNRRIFAYLFWRGAGAVERARLESVCAPTGVPRVRIPPSPLFLPYKHFITTQMGSFQLPYL